MDAFDYIKTNIDIYTVVSQYVALRRIGGYWKGSCPFHVEKDASFTISPIKGIFYCFGCHQTGDVTGFLAKIKGCSQAEAVLSLVQEFKLKLPEEACALISAPSQEQEAFFKACNFFSDWTADQLARSEVCQSYLRARKVQGSSVERFKLGYCPDLRSTGFRELLSAAVSKGVLVKDLELAGILSTNQDGQIWSPYWSRILFPIRNWQGKTCGFGGRTIIPGDSRPKYYNSRDSEFFHKGQLFFGLDLAKNEIKTKNSVIVVEGYFDCLMLSQAGFLNTIATLGTACTESHFDLLARLAQKVYFFYDGDKSGQAAIVKVAKMAFALNVEAFAVPVQPGEDPASAVVKDLPIKNWLENSLPIMKFYVSTLGTAFFQASVSERLTLVQTLLSAIDLVKNPIKKEFLLLDAAQYLQISLPSLKKGLKSVAQNTSKVDLPVADHQQEIKLTLDWQAFFIFLAEHKEGRDQVNFSPELISMVDLEIQRLLDKFYQICSNDPCDGQCYSQLILELPENLRSFVDKGVASFSGDLNRKTFDAIVQRIKVDAMKKRVRLAIGQINKSQEHLEEIVKDTKVLVKR